MTTIYETPLRVENGLPVETAPEYTVTWRDPVRRMTIETARMPAAGYAYWLCDQLRARGRTDAVVLTYY